MAVFDVPERFSAKFNELIKLNANSEDKFMVMSICEKMPEI